jgi:hypothetical protein
MTAQIDDLFRYQNATYSVSGISEGELFDPSQLGLEPTGTCTACWRGYQAVFAMVDSQLVLDTLHVNLLTAGAGYTRQEGPPINGVSPTGPSEDYDWFNNHYVGIHYHLDYTGGLLLADGFIEDLYVHMGFHPAWKYTKVIELVFKNGVLQHEFDRSERMAEIRQLILDSRRDGDRRRMPTDREISEFVQSSFDRTYIM